MCFDMEFANFVKLFVSLKIPHLEYVVVFLDEVWNR